MIIAVYYEETNVCHTIFDTGRSPHEVPPNGIEVEEYNLDYLDSYYSGTEWFFNPDRNVYKWDSETMSYVEKNPSLDEEIELEEVAEEPPTGE